MYCVRPEYTEEEANEESIEDDPMDEQIEGGLYGIPQLNVFWAGPRLKSILIIDYSYPSRYALANSWFTKLNIPR